VIQRLLLLCTAILTVTSCSGPEIQLRIPFVAQFDGWEIGCTPSKTGSSLSDLRFFVSSVRAIRDDGVAVDLVLQPDDLWQQADLALLDFEDGTGACDNGTPATNTVLRGTLPIGEYRGLLFTIGVPFELNHSDPLLAAAPLDDTAMHWHWRAGYKFMRAGIRTADDGFWIHLGSTGCEGTVQNITGCRFPNRVEVLLPEFTPGDDSVVVDLAALLRETNLLDTHATDCSSGPAEQSCEVPFRALGLDFATGSVLDAQNVFLRRAGQ
jgi:uncharacterized repeat protein (TIGR04052 family)